MRRPAYFAPGEEVIVDSAKCPDMNGPAVIVNRMWISARKGAKDGWVYQMMGQDTGRWLMERSLKKDCRACGLSFDQLLESIHVPSLSKAHLTFRQSQEIMDEIMRRKAGGQTDGQAQDQQ